MKFGKKTVIGLILALLVIIIIIVVIIIASSNSCPGGYVKNKNGVCKKIGGVCLPQSVLNESSKEMGICYINLNQKPSLDSNCANIRELYNYDNDEWFRNGDYSDDQYKNTVPNTAGDDEWSKMYACSGRAVSLAELCQTDVNKAEYKNVSPKTYTYDKQGECVSTGKCVNNWPKYNWVLDNGSCKEDIR